MDSYCTPHHPLRPDREAHQMLSLRRSTPLWDSARHEALTWLHTRLALMVALLLLCGALPSVGQHMYSASEITERETAHPYVRDPEGHLSYSEVVKLQDALAALHEQHTVEVLLVVVPAVEDDDPERFTEALFRRLGIGNRSDDNGLLILYCYHPDYRQVRFETGYGLEGVLPDAATASITHNILVPAIKRGKEVEGFVAAIDEISTILQSRYTPVESDEQQRDWLDELFTGDVSDWLDELFTGDVSDWLDKLFAGDIGDYLRASFYWGVLFISIFAVRLAFTRSFEHKLELVSDITELTAAFWLIGIFLLPSLLMGWVFRKLGRFMVLNAWYKCPECSSMMSVHRVPKVEALQYLSDLTLTEHRLGTCKVIVMACKMCSYYHVYTRHIKQPGVSRCPKCWGYTLVTTQIPQNGVNSYVTYKKCQHCGYEKMSDPNFFFNPRKHIPSSGTRSYFGDNLSRNRGSSWSSGRFGGGRSGGGRVDH